MPGLLLHLLLTGLGWGLLASASGACELISPADLQAAVQQTEALEQRSQLPGVCRYSWRKADWEAIEAANQEQLKNLSRSSEGYQPGSIWARLEVEVYFAGESTEQAMQRYSNTLAGDLPRSYGSPDPTASARFEKVAAHQAWSAANRQLLVHKGPRVYLLQLDVHPEADKDKALALKLAAQLP